jgi:Tol biopolymer transport system component
MRRLIAAVLGLVLVLAASAAAAQRATPTGTIVFAADRSPVAFGEIYRVELNGATVDLSRSAALDVSPTVSPDGSHVAFVSGRGGHLALYVVGIDRRGLRRISPFGPFEEGVNSDAQIAWSPDGTRVFAEFGPEGAHSTATVWVGDLSGRGRVVGHAFLTDPVWSPDAKEIAYQLLPTGGAEVDVVSPANKLLWSVRGDVGFPLGWGKGGRLVVAYRGTTAVYDESGHKLTSFLAGQDAWSPDGTELASLRGARLLVRHDGIGAPFVDATVAAGTIQWLGNDRLRIFTDNGYVGYDVAHDKALALPAPFAADEFGSVVSADGNAVTDTSTTQGFTATLRVATWDGGDGPTLASGVPCSEQPWWTDMSFTPNGKSLVYETGCAEPNADIYSIGADGKHLEQLTDTSAHELEPAWSPDGTRIAYVQQLTANKCDGCADTLWVMNADGSDQHEVTPPSEVTHDQHPTWSPNGTELAFWRWTFTSGRIAVVPATGGAVRTIVANGDDPAWGPSRIAYVNGSVAPTLVQTVTPDGTKVRTVASDSGAVTTAVAYSRTGKIAYLRTDPEGRLQLVVTGTKRRMPLGGLHASYAGSALAWSPDGTRLAFDAIDDAGISDLWLVDADGTHLTRLTHGIGAVEGLSWAVG